MEHKQASLEELGALADPPLTKDAVAGRIRRLLAMADKRAQDLGIPGTESNLDLSEEMADNMVELTRSPVRPEKGPHVRPCGPFSGCITRRAH